MTCRPARRHDLVSLKRRAKVTIKTLAEALGVTQAAGKKARKEGVPGTEVEQWLATIGPVPDVPPMPKKRSVRKVACALSNAACVAFAMLLTLLYGKASGQS